MVNQHIVHLHKNVCPKVLLYELHKAYLFIYSRYLAVGTVL